MLHVIYYGVDYDDTSMWFRSWLRGQINCHKKKFSSRRSSSRLIIRLLGNYDKIETSFPIWADRYCMGIDWIGTRQEYSETR